MIKQSIKRLAFGLLLGLTLLAGGCATYGSGINAALEQAKHGEYASAEISIEKVLKPDGKDRLLYYLELASIKSLAGEYEASNQLLERAEQIADDLETKSLSDALVVMMSNPRKGTYTGTDFERIFINYSKALNYFSLAQLSTSQQQRLQALDGARVEARRLIMRINDINTRRGQYAIEDDEQATFAKIANLFSKLLLGNLVDLQSLQYRDDAMAHYLTGISFEQSGEYDNARISYQNAAQAYERGYAKQYLLDEEIISQAWFDTIRMMQRAGGYGRESQRLAQQKLSAQQRQELKQWTRDKAQIIILEHKGSMPHREEMNLVLALNQDLHAFQMHPLFELDNEDGLAWFYMLYADKGVAGIVSSFMVAKHYGLLTYGMTKTIPLGPLWHEAASIGLLEAMDPALRVAVPYYRAVEPLPQSTLTINGQNQSLIKSSNPALMAIQEQMVNSGRDINQAFSRAALKAVLAQQVGSVGGEYGSLLSLAAKVAFQFTEAAETRNWLLLPQEIRLARLVVEPGEHELTLDSRFKNSNKEHQTQISLDSGDIYLWQVNSL